jgi:putative tryptophan/tyrosine transport system substrate-binding protein
MDRPSRRRFLRGGLALAGLGLLAGCGISQPMAQPAVPVHRVGYLTLSGDERAAAERLAAFRDGLRDLGQLEGRNLVIEVRRTDSLEGLPELATELTRLPVDVIVASPTQSALAAKKATNTIPIVFPLAVDPIGTGLVESLARPGGM